jgi:hypothetical protein
MQQYCSLFAEAWNYSGMPKKVFMLPCNVGILTDGTCYLIEPFLEGKYVKHNNNGSYDRGVRNTPAAFSHFTHWISNGKLLICDLQGVGDYYTDPQIHTSSGIGFGIGNLGQKGIQAFFSTHKCNYLCKKLGLDKSISSHGRVKMLAKKFQHGFWPPQNTMINSIEMS